jgi:26S proteasome regulatory subunit N9
MKEVWSTKSGDLVSAEEELFEKIRLLSIMEHVFRRQSKDRKIAFSEIAASAQIDESSVEMLVMKALCIGLVRGSIDQIDQAATFTWVQPRVLDLAQLADIHSRLGTWLERVDATSTSLVSSAPELFASA